MLRQGNAVVAALADLFGQFEGAGGARAVVAPTALREALHAHDPAAFSLGEMSDAAEVLTAIYDSLRQARPALPCDAPPPHSGNALPHAHNPVQSACVADRFWIHSSSCA